MSAHAASGPSPEQLRGAALEYAARGVPVLPLHGKLPLIPAAHRPGDPAYQQCKGDCGRQGHGVHDATTDPGQLRAWWERWPAANVGLRTGVCFDVIDVDGQTGRRSLERFLAEHGGPARHSDRAVAITVSTALSSAGNPASVNVCAAARHAAAWSTISVSSRSNRTTS